MTYFFQFYTPYVWAYTCIRRFAIFGCTCQIFRAKKPLKKVNGNPEISLIR